ncbi:MAG: hypothetical protein R2940_17090 [Syntrophotaleaceae bacterium]
MKKWILVIGTLVLFSGTAMAEKPNKQISLFKPAAVSSIARRPVKARPEFTLIVHAPEEKISPPPKTPIADELLPPLLRERAYSEPETVAGVQVALPNLRPLNIVLAADDYLNPTWGIKIHLPW